MEECAQLVVLELGEAITACRSGAIPDMKTEIGLLRLADHLGYLPQLSCFVDELPAELAARHTPLYRPGDYAQAVMDLGATICTPRKPRCPHCPMQAICQAYGEGDPEAYPPPRKRTPTPHYDVTAGVIWRGEQLLIAQRPLEGLLAIFRGQDLVTRRFQVCFD